MLAMFGLPGGTEIIVVGLIALLIFGKKLPVVARSIGSSFVQFKKGLKDVQDEVNEPIEEVKLLQQDIKEFTKSTTTSD
jgi:TatA/E family protein of Tat protein translocase